MRRITWTVLIVIGAAVLGVSFLAWRAQQDNMSLLFVKSLIQPRIEKALSGRQIDYSDLKINWNRQHNEMRLVFDDFQVLRSSETFTSAFIETLSLTAKTDSLLSGQFKIRSLMTQGLQLRLTVDDMGQSGAPLTYADLKEQWLGLSKDIGAVELISDFEGLFFNRSNVLLNRDGRDFSILIPSLQLEKSGAVFQLSGDAVLAAQPGEMSFNLLAEYEPSGLLDVVIKLKTLDPGALLAGFGLADWENSLKTQLDATLEVAIGPDNQGDRLDLDVHLAQGQFEYGDIYDGGARDFHAFDLTATYRPALDILRLTKADLRFGPAVLTVQGRLQNVLSKPALTVEGALNGLDVPALKTYWPHIVGKNAFIWVRDNIASGQLPNARVKFDVAPDQWGPQMPKTALQFDFDIEALVAHYHRPMPPLTQAWGRGRLTLDDLDLHIEKGVIQGLSVADSRVFISRFSVRPQTADIRLKLEGPIQKLLHVIDSEPLGYISDFGLEPDSVRGEASGETKLVIPLLKDLKIEEVALEARVDAVQLAMPDLFEFGSIEEGNARFDVTTEGLHAVGDMKFADIAVHVDWYEDFRQDIPQATRADAIATISDADLERFGIDLGQRFKGQFQTRINILGNGADVSSGTIVADFKNAEISIPIFDWQKAQGEEASLRALLNTDGGFNITDAVFAGPDMHADFDLSIVDDGVRFAASKAVFGDNDLSISADVFDGAWDVQIKGRSLNVSPILTQLYAVDSDEDTQATSPLPWPDFQGVVDLERVVLANGTALLGMTGRTRVVDDHMTRLVLNGMLNGESGFSLDLEEVEEDIRKLTLRAEDAGLTAKGLDLFTKGAGGSLELNAEIRGRQQDIEIDGLATMAGFRLTEAPVLARLLSTASLSGIADLARDGRIEFRNAEVPFTLRDGIFDIDDASANGPALGLTMGGQFVQSLKEANLKGVIVPAYGFNSLIGRVPIIGSIITGGDNEGLIAINYSITGPLTDPELSVNPASMLAPGILRKIFSGGKGKVSVPEITPTPPEESEARPH